MTPLFWCVGALVCVRQKVEVTRAVARHESQLWRPPRDVSCAYPHETGAGAIVGNGPIKNERDNGIGSVPTETCNSPVSLAMHAFVANCFGATR